MSGLLTLELPEPPTLNTMISLAKRKTHSGPFGRYMRTAQSQYWVQQQEYQQAVGNAVLLAASAGALKPGWLTRPWPRWTIVAAHFRLHQQRDLLELQAGLKWAVDALKEAGVVVDDSPRHLLDVAKPTWEVARRQRGVTLTIAEAA